MNPNHAPATGAPHGTGRREHDPPERPDLAVLPEADAATELGRLFEAHRAGLYRYLSRRVGPTTAEDAVGETFLAALRGRHGYDPGRADVRAWLFGIAANVMRRHVRTELQGLRLTARLASRPGADRAADHADAVADRVDAQRWVRQLAAALAELNAEDRELLLLSSWADLNATEIGMALDLPASTVRSRLFRIRRQLRARIPAIDPNDNGRNTS